MWSEEDKRKIQNEFGNIFKKVSHRKWKCIQYDCNNEAINSHLLQKNGILNYVSEEGKVVVVRQKSIYGLKKDEMPLSFQKIGIKEALSYDIFCQHHDTTLFREIEDGYLDFNKYIHCVF